MRTLVALSARALASAAAACTLAAAASAAEVAAESAPSFRFQPVAGLICYSFARRWAREVWDLLGGFISRSSRLTVYLNRLLISTSPVLSAMKRRCRSSASCRVLTASAFARSVSATACCIACRASSVSLLAGADGDQGRDRLTGQVSRPSGPTIWHSRASFDLGMQCKRAQRLRRPTEPQLWHAADSTPLQRSIGFAELHHCRVRGRGTIKRSLQPFNRAFQKKT